MKYRSDTTGWTAHDDLHDFWLQVNTYVQKSIKTQYFFNRLAAYKKALKEAQKEKAKAIQERMKACLEAAAQAHKNHMAEARQTFEKLCTRLDRAQEFRDNKLDPALLQASSNKSLAMTQHRLKNAKEKMSRTCDELQHYDMLLL